MENKVSRRSALKGLAGLVAGACIGGAVLSGCAQPEYETRIRNAYKKENQDFQKNLIDFYKSIEPKRLTNQQKQALKVFEQNPEKYLEDLRNMPWINAENPTIRDKIYIVEATHITLQL